MGGSKTSSGQDAGTAGLFVRHAVLFVQVNVVKKLTNNLNC